MGCNGSLRERVADELAHNDECGPGPVSRAEYLADADALLDLVTTELLNELTIDAALAASIEPHTTPWAGERERIAKAIRGAISFALPGSQNDG